MLLVEVVMYIETRKAMYLVLMHARCAALIVAVTDFLVGMALGFAVMVVPLMRLWLGYAVAPKKKYVLSGMRGPVTVVHFAASVI